jgi:iron-sulfur cluster assembly protein
MPPPKNSGTPETSISDGQLSWPPSAPWQQKDSSAGVSLREGEAQKSKQTAAAPTTTTIATTSTSPQKAAAKPKKSKLRPRKAPITLTPKAVEQLHVLFDQPESKLIRVGVKNRGCSGLAYHLEYVEKAGAFDETVEQDGVKVLIDSKALFSIIGSEMDWLEDKLSARFIFRNPNISECIYNRSGKKNGMLTFRSGTVRLRRIVQHLMIIAYGRSEYICRAGVGAIGHCIESPSLRQHEIVIRTCRAQSRAHGHS